MEILFEQDNEEKSVASLILDALVKVEKSYSSTCMCKVLCSRSITLWMKAVEIYIKGLSWPRNKSPLTSLVEKTKYNYPIFSGLMVEPQKKVMKKREAHVTHTPFSNVSCKSGLPIRIIYIIGHSSD